MLCPDLSVLATYAKVDNPDYRLLKAHTPGPYTFILSATSEVPRRLMHPKKRTIGIRVPDHPICQALLNEHGGPIMTSTAHLPDDEFPLTDPQDVRDFLQGQVDLVIDGGFCGVTETAVISLADGSGPEVVREAPARWTLSSERVAPSLSLHRLFLYNRRFPPLRQESAFEFRGSLPKSGIGHARHRAPAFGALPWRA